MDSLCHVRNKIMYVLLWLTVYALTRVLFWCLFPSLQRNSGNKHQNNPLVSALTVSPCEYIHYSILNHITVHNIHNLITGFKQAMWERSAVGNLLVSLFTVRFVFSHKQCIMMPCSVGLSRQRHCTKPLPQPMLLKILVTMGSWMIASWEGQWNSRLIFVSMQLIVHLNSVIKHYVLGISCCCPVLILL